MDVQDKNISKDEWCLRLRELLVVLLDATRQLQALADALATQGVDQSQSVESQPITVRVHVDFQLAVDVAAELAHALLDEPDRLRAAAHAVVECCARVHYAHAPRLRVELRVSRVPAQDCAAQPDLGLRTLQGVLVARTGAPSQRGDGERRLVRALLAPPCALQRARAPRFQACTHALFPADLGAALALGERYDVIGRHTPVGFEAWGVAKWSPAPPPVPRPIASLHQELSAGSSYRLPAELASRLGSNLVPATAHRGLRMALLLSLASLDAHHLAVPLLLAGADSLATHALCVEAARLAPRCVLAPWGVAWPKGGGAKQNEEAWQWAGPTQLANGGVCLVSDWSLAKEGHRRALLTALESGLETAHGAPLRCAVWAVYPHDFEAPAARKQLRALLNVFGVPIVAEAGVHDEAVADFVLAAAQGRSRRHPTKPDETLRQFLTHARSLEVTLDSTASRLVRNYFVASRRMRPDFLPVNAIQTITALAEAHARLALRTRGCVDDVIAVLALYEDTRAHVMDRGQCSASLVIGCPDVDLEMAALARRVHEDVEAALGPDAAAAMPPEE